MLRLAIVITPALAIIAACYAISPTLTMIGVGLGFAALSACLGTLYVRERQR